MTQKTSSSKSDVKHHADENEKATDSWLIYLSRDFGKACRRGSDEVDMLVDSAKCAYVTTKKITKKMVCRVKQGKDLNSRIESLLVRLDFIIAGCRKGEYSSLRDNAEFWQLIKDLHPLGKKLCKKTKSKPKSKAKTRVERIVIEGAPSENTEELRRKDTDAISQEASEKIPKKEETSKSAVADTSRTEAPSSEKEETPISQSDFIERLKSAASATKKKETKKSGSRPSPGQKSTMADSATKAASAKKSTGQSKPTTGHQQKKGTTSKKD